MQQLCSPRSHLCLSTPFEIEAKTQPKTFWSCRCDFLQCQKFMGNSYSVSPFGLILTFALTFGTSFKLLSLERSLSDGLGASRSGFEAASGLGCRMDITSAEFMHFSKTTYGSSVHCQMWTPKVLELRDSCCKASFLCTWVQHVP